MVNNNSHNRLLKQSRVPSTPLDVLNRAQPVRLVGPHVLALYHADFNRAIGEYTVGHFEEGKSILCALIATLEPVLHTQKIKADAAQFHLLYASALTWLGRTYERLNSEKEAKSAFKKAKAEFGEWISKPKEVTGQVYLDYGVALFKRGSTNRSLEAFIQAANKGALNAEGNLYMGICLWRLKRSKEAEERFREALTQEPDHYMSRKALAKLLEEEKRIPEAVNEYRTAIFQMVDSGSVDEALEITEHTLVLAKQDPELLALKGNILRLQGDMPGALEALNRSLKREPKNAFANAVKGLLLLETDDEEEGIRLLEHAFEMNPKIDWVPVELALALSNSGKHEKALSILNKALSKNPLNVNALVQKGVTLSDMGRTEEALDALDKALELKPNDAVLVGTKGQVLRYLNEYKKAVKVLRRSIELDRRLAWVHAELGAALYGLNEYYDALVALVDALAIEPDNVFALSYKSEILRALGKVEGSVDRAEEALQVINQALALSPNDAWALGTKAQVLRDLGRLEEAVEVLEQSVQIHPKLGWIHLELAVTQYSLTNYDAALEALDNALRLEDESEWHFFKGQILCEIAKFKDALETLNHAIKLNSNLSPAYGLKGWALQHLGEEEAENALKAYEFAAKLEPKNLWWHKGIANALYLMGSEREASAKYKWVLKRAEVQSNEQPDDISLLSLRGWCEYRLGNCAEAVKMYRQVASLSPTEISNYFDLALALICSEHYSEGLNEYRRGVQHSTEQPAQRRHCLIFIALDDLKVAIRMQPGLAQVLEVADASTLLETNLNPSLVNELSTNPI